MGELTEGSAHRIVFAVVHGVLEEIALADLMFAVVSVRFIGVEIDLPEKSARKIR